MTPEIAVGWSALVAVVTSGLRPVACGLRPADGDRVVLAWNA